jgi:ribosome-associated toxin RatA of RatAB toxin-antitoxin module
VITSGMATLEEIEENETKVSLTLHFEPDSSLAEGLAEDIFGDVAGLVEQILQNFKVYAINVG